jgi:hypothetical protein
MSRYESASYLSSLLQWFSSNTLTVLEADELARGDDGPALLGSFAIPRLPALPLRPEVVRIN